MRVIRAFFGITHPQKWGALVRTFEATAFRDSFEVTWSQMGEDIGLAMVLGGLKKGRFVDVGAHHPSRYSNTRKLVSMGWTGVNIEANPDLLAAFHRDRPKDTNLFACVGTEKEYELAIFEDPAISTRNLEWQAKMLDANQVISSKIRVPGITLEEIFRKYFRDGFPDLLLIDAEGSDLDVLQSANLSVGVGPEWLLLETETPLSRTMEMPTVQYAMKLGYEIHLLLGASVLLHKKVW
jgi:FkbM family methyltransferase